MLPSRMLGLGTVASVTVEFIPLESVAGERRSESVSGDRSLVSAGAASAIDARKRRERM